MNDVAFAAKLVSKGFPGVQALDQVSFELRRGEIHALLGENGAGKSTFVKIVTGAYQRDSGQIEIYGTPAHFTSPSDAYNAGVGAVFQEFSLVPNLSVAENIFLGEWPRRSGLVDWGLMNSQATALLTQFGVQATCDDALGKLGIATRQMIEILKACRKPHIRILILDEPTSALSDGETDTLFQFLRVLKQRGVSMIYISHRLGEIQRICDRITVFRNGKNIETCSARDVQVETIVRMMVGRSMTDRFPPKPATARPGGLVVAGLTTKKLRSISFDARRGEILGVAGLIGAGKTELLRAIFGADANESGAISLDGDPIEIRDPRDAIAHGFGFLPESRKDHGLIMTSNNIVNISLAALKQFAAPFLDLKRERSDATKWMNDVDVRPSDPDYMVSNLSGGNQQKIILARWLMAQTSVLLFDEPTRGIDVGAKYQIYAIMAELARKGCCVIVASSEGEELVGICNRVLIMSKGAIVATFEGDFDEETLLHACAAEARH
jgi:ribose transport system ATP-binding protein